MLVKFAVENYRGFAERIEFDLSKPKNYEFNTHAVKDGIIKNGIIYGPNGSGKSNFGLAIFDIVNHLSQKWKKPDYYINFVYAGEPNKPVKFEYVFKFGNVLIEYSYAKNKHGALQEEKLIADKKQIFNRVIGKFNIDSSFPIEENMKINLQNNANNISIVNFLLTSYPLAENHYLLQLRNFVDSMLWFRCLEQREFIGLETNGCILDEYIIRNNLVKDFQLFIKDISNQDFEFVTPNPNDKMLFCYIKGHPMQFDLIASTGTHSIKLLYYWTKQMDKTSFVFIDEFDAFYHFKLAFEVCKKLFSLNCQVFASSHNTYLMTNDLLRPDCNFVLNHNKIKSLSDCTDKELREGHNIEKLFRGGTFEI